MHSASIDALEHRRMHSPHSIRATGDPRVWHSPRVRPGANVPAMDAIHPVVLWEKSSAICLIGKGISSLKTFLENRHALFVRGQHDRLSHFFFFISRRNAVNAILPPRPHHFGAAYIYQLGHRSFRVMVWDRSRASVFSTRRMFRALCHL